MATVAVRCPDCDSDQVVKRGKSGEGKQRYLCRNEACSRTSFILDYSYRGWLPEVKAQMVDMALNGSGIRDTSRVLKVSTSTVINALKKSRSVGASQSRLSRRAD